MSQKTPSVTELIRAASAPCLVVRETDLDGIRQKSKQTDWAAAAFKQLQDRAEAGMAKKINIPDKGGQWPHWYACETDGSKLEFKAKTGHVCPACGRVYSGEPWDSVPLTDIHAELSRTVRTLGVYYALTGSRKAAQQAAQILLEYADRYPHYPLRDHGQHTNTAWTAKVSWGTLGESIWLLPLCEGYDLIRHADVFTPADHQCIREQLLRPAAKLILKNNLGIHNIQSWHNAAIGMAGLLLRDRDLVAFALESEVGIHSQIARGILPDGFWLEGSWGYHFYAMEPLLAWAETLRNCGLDLYSDHFRRMFEAPFLAKQPDGTLPAFHDSDNASMPQAAPSYEIAYARYGDARFAWPLAHGNRHSLNALLYGVPDLPAKIPETESSTHLPRSGFVYLRQGPARDRTYLAFDYGPHGGAHGHPDKLAFTLYGKGRILAPDPGSVAYGVPIHHQWYKQTVSHNTLVVDGHSQKSCTGKLDLLVNGPDFDLISSTADEAYEGVRISRSLLLMHDLVLIIDRLSGEHMHTYDWVYHNRGQMRTVFPRKQLSTPPGETDGFEHILDPRSGQPEEDWRVNWRTGTAGVRLSMIGSRRVPTKVITGEGWDNAEGATDTSKEGRTPLVIARRRNRRTTYRCALQLFKNRPVPEELIRTELDPPARARGITLRRKNTEFTYIITLIPGPVSWQSITFEGQALFAESGGKNERVVLAGGTRLVWMDRTWTLESASSVQFENTSKGIRLTNLGKEAASVAVGDQKIPLSPGQQWIVT
ncbi:MAG: alginate lyase family protein [bacterium]|nr:alginate lyase family protein [bacterium]